MAINYVAKVENGELVDYTGNSSKKTEGPGSELGYDQFLQLLCAEMTNQDPLEPTSNTEYVAQLATFSQLEATLSLTETQEHDMAHNLVGKQVVLKLTSETTGNISYVNGKVDYIMYESGEVYLSVNDKLYSIDTLDTVADSDYYDACIIAQTFEDMVAELPDMENLTIDWKAGLEGLREMYDGMTSYQQTFVSSDSLTTLREYEEKMTEVEKVADAKAQETLRVFEGMMEKLPELSELTTEWQTSLEEARAYYDDMTSYQKGYVSEESLNTLTEYEEKMAELVKQEEPAKENEAGEESTEGTDVV